jgi:hypothetical protein
VASIKANADRRAASVLPVIREIKKTGALTLRELADALNARGIATARGGKCYATSVHAPWLLNAQHRPCDRNNPLARRSPIVQPSTAPSSDADRRQAIVKPSAVRSTTGGALRGRLDYINGGP